MLVVLHKKLRGFSPRQKLYFYYLISLSPGVSIILSRFGTSDLLMIGFSIIAAASFSQRSCYIYLFLMAISHSEISFAIAMVLGTTVLTRKNKDNVGRSSLCRRRFFFLALLSILLTSIFTFDNFKGSRLSAFPELLKVSLGQALSSGTWLIYSWLGSIWIILLSLAPLMKGTSKLHLPLIFSLGILSLVTADGTRVSASLLTFYTAFIVRNIIANNIFPSKQMLAIAWIAPAISISNLNVLLPFHQLLYFLNLNPTIVILQH